MMKTFILSIGMLVLATVAFAQNCLRIVQPTLFSGPAANSTYTLTINFQTNGNKSLQTTIFCGSTVIFSDCFSAQGPGTKVYPNLVCSGGLATLSFLLYCALLAHLKKSAQQYRARPSIAPVLVTLGIILLVAQITLGGWVSTNYAALACPDFPKCKGDWLPETDFKEGFVVWREIGVNYEGGVLDAPARAAVHITHRVGAIVVSCYLLLLAFLALRRKAASLFPGGNIRTPALLMCACLLMQIGLGISNIVFALPLWVAVGHNAMAAMLLSSIIWLWWRNSGRDVAKG